MVDASVWVDVERGRLAPADIAAVAIQHGLKVLTRNRRDFEGISGLDLLVL